MLKKWSSKVCVGASGCGCRVSVNDFVFVGKAWSRDRIECSKGEVARGRGRGVEMYRKSTGRRMTASMWKREAQKNVTIELKEDFWMEIMVRMKALRASWRTSLSSCLHVARNARLVDTGLLSGRR